MLASSRSGRSFFLAIWTSISCSAWSDNVAHRGRYRETAARNECETAARNLKHAGVGSLPILVDLDPASPLVYCPCLALPRLSWPPPPRARRRGRKPAVAWAARQHSSSRKKVLSWFLSWPGLSSSPSPVTVTSFCFWFRLFPSVTSLSAPFLLTFYPNFTFIYPSCDLPHI